MLTFLRNHRLVNRLPTFILMALPALVILVFVLLSPTAVLGASHGDQTIIGVETWTVSDSPHNVNGIVTVDKGARLIIEPGAVVYFAPDYRSGLVVKGSLTAIGGPAGASIFLGTEGAHRLLGSPKPSVPSWPPQYWRGIEFRDASDPSVLDRVIIASALVGAQITNSIVELANS